MPCSGILFIPAEAIYTHQNARPRGVPFQLSQLLPSLSVVQDENEVSYTLGRGSPYRYSDHINQASQSRSVDLGSV